LLVISSQKFKGSVSPVVRSNATDVIIGSPFPNQKELLAIAEEYGDMYETFPNAQLITTNSFFLGTYVGLTDEKLEYIKEAVDGFFENL
jgi:dTDP-4-amino-4,6-dideoxygalactose transaminase